MHHPPVNAITVGRHLAHPRRLRATSPTSPRGRPRHHPHGRGQGLQRRHRHQGDAVASKASSTCSARARRATRRSTQIYRTPVPVIAAVNDFCMGLGVGLVGSCDIIVASTKARFGLPEVDNGALGCASHLAKLVPPMKLRQMVVHLRAGDGRSSSTHGAPSTGCASPTSSWPTAREVAAKIAKKQPARRAGREGRRSTTSTSYDLQHNYRLEQGFTYELNLYGDGDEARDAFVRKEREITR